MAWKKLYWDLTFVPLGILSFVLYHCWLWRMVKKRPHRTNIGVSNAGLNLWVSAMVKDNDKKNVMAVQSLRNILMGSTMVATSSFLICCGLLAFTSTISDKRRLVLSSLNRVEVTRKCAVLVPAFLTVFFCHVLSITFLNQVTMLVNILIQQECKITVEQATLMLAKGMLMTTIGNRLFFAAMPLVLWLYSPVLVFACSVAIVAALYSTDIVRKEGRARAAAVNNGNGEIIPT